MPELPQQAGIASADTVNLSLVMESRWIYYYIVKQSTLHCGRRRKTPLGEPIP